MVASGFVLPSTAPKAAAHRPAKALDGVRNRRAAHVPADDRHLLARMARGNVMGAVLAFPDHAPDFVVFLDHVQHLKA